MFNNLKAKKIGRVFNPSDYSLVSHAQVPVPLIINNKLRVFFSSRSIDNISHIYSADFFLDNNFSLSHFENKPILKPGKMGDFDDSGVMPSSIIRHGEEIWLYYTAWNKRATVPYHNSTGLACSSNGVEFIRKFNGPILDRTREEPYLAVMPDVVRGRIWEMWYCSGTGWEYHQDRFESKYVIKYAFSENGIDWNRPSKTCLKDDYVYASPSVFTIEDTTFMLFCYRAVTDFRSNKDSAYKIGLAKKFQNSWRVIDDNFIEYGEKGEWDDAMICYPKYFYNNGKHYVLYNGNDFGKTGFGLVELVYE
ncbi:hypothetical protein ABMA70_09330 [Halobacteriovorax sp. XZX-3]|uniref:hypothetical protein n=1 Tax=unclassified Halobacteriovorax TaxID=2639665 RepID=UPI0037187E6B